LLTTSLAYDVWSVLDPFWRLDPCGMRLAKAVKVNPPIWGPLRGTFVSSPWFDGGSS
jgi:hypothetical protein